MRAAHNPADGARAMRGVMTAGPPPASNLPELGEGASQAGTAAAAGRASAATATQQRQQQQQQQQPAQQRRGRPGHEPITIADLLAHHMGANSHLSGGTTLSNQLPVRMDKRPSATAGQTASGSQQWRGGSGMEIPEGFRLKGSSKHRPSKVKKELIRLRADRKLAAAQEHHAMAAAAVAELRTGCESLEQQLRDVLNSDGSTYNHGGGISLQMGATVLQRAVDMAQQRLQEGTNMLSMAQSQVDSALAERNEVYELPDELRERVSESESGSEQDGMYDGMPAALAQLAAAVDETSAYPQGFAPAGAHVQSTGPLSNNSAPHAATSGPPSGTRLQTQPPMHSTSPPVQEHAKAPKPNLMLVGVDGDGDDSDDDDDGALPRGWTDTLATWAKQQGGSGMVLTDVHKLRPLAPITHSDTAAIWKHGDSSGDRPQSANSTDMWGGGSAWNTMQGFEQAAVHGQSNLQRKHDMSTASQGPSSGGRMTQGSGTAAQKHGTDRAGTSPLHAGPSDTNNIMLALAALRSASAYDTHDLPGGSLQSSAMSNWQQTVGPGSGSSVASVQANMMTQLLHAAQSGSRGQLPSSQASMMSQLLQAAGPPSTGSSHSMQAGLMNQLMLASGAGSGGLPAGVAPLSGPGLTRGGEADENTVLGLFRANGVDTDGGYNNQALFALAQAAGLTLDGSAMFKNLQSPHSMPVLPSGHSDQSIGELAALLSKLQPSSQDVHSQGPAPASAPSNPAMSAALAAQQQQQQREVLLHNLKALQQGQQSRTDAQSNMPVASPSDNNGGNLGIVQQLLALQGKQTGGKLQPAQMHPQQPSRPQPPPPPPPASGRMLGELSSAGVTDLGLVPGSQGWQTQMHPHIGFRGMQMPGQMGTWPATRSEQWQPPLAATPGMQYLHPGMMQPGGGMGVYAPAAHAGPGSWQGTYSAPQQIGMLGARSSATGPPPPPPLPLLTSQFQCEICHIQCNSQINLDQHLASRKHLQRAARLAAAGVEAAAKEARAVLGIKKGPGITYVGPNAVVHSLCKQMIVPELNAVVNELLSRVRAFQHRAVARNALKAAAHCWYVCGLREVRKAVRLGRAKSVIVAPNIEEMDHMTGLDGHLQDILSISASQSVPVVFALTRKRLGKIYGCRKRVSAVALLDYHGVEALHERMIQLVHEGHEAWGKLHASGEKQPHILVDEGGGEAGDDDDDDDDDEDDEEEEYEVGNDGNADDDDVLEHAG